MKLGPLDSMFDFDNDGKLSAFERGAEMDFLERMSREEKKGQNSDRDQEYNWPWGNRETDEE